MHYFTFENDELVLHECETLPQKIEETYIFAREKYSIEYHRSDWADDDRDAGMGYDYDNSYTIYREPKRNELVIKDGKLFGFYLGFGKDDIEKPDAKYLVDFYGKNQIYESNTYSEFYGDSHSWTLITEEDPLSSGYIFLLRVKENDAEHIFTPAEFSEEFIESIAEKIEIQDTRGHFDGAFRIKLKLKPEAVKNPAAVLAALSEYRPMLVKK